MFSPEEIAREMEMTERGEPMLRLAKTICKNVLLSAAGEVESHWNDSTRIVNQKEQAARSAEVLRNLAIDLK